MQRNNQRKKDTTIRTELYPHLTLCMDKEILVYQRNAKHVISFLTNILGPLIPDIITLEKASNIFSDIFEKVFLNEQQIQTLQKTRDTLLPKLMSGEVRVEGYGN